LVLTVLELSVLDDDVDVEDDAAADDDDDDDDPVPAAAAVASVTLLTTPMKTYNANKMIVDLEEASLTGLQQR
jgi:hypothetical protein